MVHLSRVPDRLRHFHRIAVLDNGALAQHGTAKARRPACPLVLIGHAASLAPY